MRALQESEWFNHGEIVDSFEYEQLIQEEEGDYQGDSLYLLKIGDQYGVLQWGWGSCSGCDALQGCDTIEEATELRDGLHASIRWGSKADTKQYLENHDWGGTFLSTDLTDAFVKRALPLLSEP